MAVRAGAATLKQRLREDSTLPPLEVCDHRGSDLLVRFDPAAILEDAQRAALVPGTRLGGECLHVGAARLELRGAPLKLGAQGRDDLGRGGVDDGRV